MASTRSSAKFTINGAASSPPGFAAAHSAVLELQLEQQPPLDTFSCTYSIAAIAPTGGETAVLSNAGVASPVGGIVTCTIPDPAAGMVAYLVRCQTNGGELTRDAQGELTADQNTFERIVVVFGFTAGVRVMIVGESTQYSAGGWCDLINALAQAVEDLSTAGLVALGTSVALPPAVAGAVGGGADAAPIDHVHPWGSAAAGLLLNRPQHASGAGLKDALRGQAAKSGAYVGGAQELGGGAGGNAASKYGDTLIVLGPAPAGGVSAKLNICSADGGSSFLGISYSDVLGKTVVESPVTLSVELNQIITGNLSFKPSAATPGATVTIAHGKSNRHRVTLDQPTAFAQPTGFADGAEVWLFVRQGTGAPWTASWDSHFVFPTGMSGTLVGNALDEVDVFHFLLELDQWVCVTHESY